MSRTGISDSRLSRIEHGKACPAEELGKLAELYKADKISLFIDAGYLSEADLEGYQQIFRNADSLTKDERAAIQQIINLLNANKEKSNDI